MLSDDSGSDITDPFSRKYSQEEIQQLEASRKYSSNPVWRKLDPDCIRALHSQLEAQSSLSDDNGTETWVADQSISLPSLSEAKLSSTYPGSFPVAVAGPLKRRTVTRRSAATVDEDAKPQLRKARSTVSEACRPSSGNTIGQTRSSSQQTRPAMNHRRKRTAQHRKPARFSAKVGVRRSERMRRKPDRFVPPL